MLSIGESPASASTLLGKLNEFEGWETLAKVPANISDWVTKQYNGHPAKRCGRIADKFKGFHRKSIMRRRKFSILNHRCEFSWGAEAGR